jgi:hypothetical protein
LRTWHSESHLRLAVTCAIVKFGDFDASLRVLPIRAFLLAPSVTRAEESEQYINDQTSRDLGYILNSGLAGNWTWRAVWCRSGFLLPEPPRVISPLLPYHTPGFRSLTQRPPVQFRQSTTSPRPSRVVWVVPLCPFYVFKSTSTSVTVWNNNQHYLSVESRTYYHDFQESRTYWVRVRNFQFHTGAVLVTMLCLLLTPFHDCDYYFPPGGRCRHHDKTKTAR